MTLAWAITYPTKDGGREIMTETVMKTEWDAVDEFKMHFRSECRKDKWDEFQRGGYRVERVRIERVEG